MNLKKMNIIKNFSLPLLLRALDLSDYLYNLWYLRHSKPIRDVISEDACCYVSL